MAILNILEYPDPRLRKKAAPVSDVTPGLRQLVDDMFETMYQAPGIGLAATQVDVHQRLLVLDISDSRDQPMCLINPEIVERDGREVSEEGCLSVPGVTEDVERAARIRVKALDRDGKPLDFEADGLLAVCIQHEIDHLDGRLFVDHLSELKRLRLRRRQQKSRQKATGASRPREPASVG